MQQKQQVKIYSKIYQQKMPTKRPNRNQKSATRSGRSMNHYASPESKKGELSLSRVSVKVSVKKQKINLYSDPKSLLPIYAYQSNSLKKCLLQDPKSMRKFFHTENQCTKNGGWKEELYAKPFLAYFREWRKDLRQRLSHIVLLITEHHKSINSEQTQKHLHQLEYIIDELQEANKEIMTHSNKEEVSNKAMKKFQQNFDHTQNYIKHLINLIRYLGEFETEVNKLLEKMTLDDSKQGNKTERKDTLRKLKDLHAHYYKLIFPSLSFCTSHPESSFLNRAQFRIKKRFDSILEQATKVIGEILRLRQSRQTLKQKLMELSANSHQNMSIKQLQQISSIIDQHQQPLEVPPPESDSYMSNPLIVELKRQISELISQFLNKFQIDSALIIENQYQILKEYKLGDNYQSLQSLVIEDNPIRTCKKKLLLLANIFNSKGFLGYYAKLSAFIKENSKDFQDANQMIKSVEDKSKARKQENAGHIARVIKHIQEIAINFQQKQDKICQAMKEKFSIQNKVETPKPRVSEQLGRFLEIWDFTLNKDAQMKQFLRIPAYPISNPGFITDEDMQKLVATNNQQISQLMEQSLPKSGSNSSELNQLMSTPLISKFVKKQHIVSNGQEQDIEGLDVCLPIIQQFYSDIYNSKHANKQINEQSVANMMECLEESVNRCSKISTSKQPIRFMQWIFETRVCMYVLNKMKKIEPVLNYPTNTSFVSKSQQVQVNKLAYRWNQQLSENFQKQRKLFSKIIDTSHKYITEKSLFDFYFNQCHDKLNTFMETQQLYEKYDSVKDNEFKPSIIDLNNWLQDEFDFSVNQSLPEISVRNTRKNVRQILTKCRDKSFQAFESKRGDQQIRNALQKNIKDLNNLVDLTQSKLISGNVLENYRKISDAIFAYIQTSGYFHVGFYSADKKPIIFLTQNYDNHMETLLENLVKKMIPKGVQNPERVQQIQLLVSGLVEYPYENAVPKVQIDAPFILEEPKANNKINPKQKQTKGEEQPQGMFVLDPIEDIVQEEVEPQENIVQQMLPSQSKVNQACFILEDKNSTRQNHNLTVIKKYYEIPSEYKASERYILESVSSLDDLAKTLRAPPKIKKLGMQNNLGEMSFVPEMTKQNNMKEFQHVRKFLKMDKIAPALQDIEPGLNVNESLVDHLQSAINLISGHRVVEKNADNQSLFTLYNSLSNLKTCIQLKNNDQKNKHFKQLLEILEIDCKCIYSDPTKENKIYILQKSEDNAYCYPILKNQTPFINQPEIISNGQFFNSASKFFGYLCMTKDNQEQNQLDVRESLTLLSESVSQSYERLRKQLSEDQNYPIQNAQQTRNKIDQYIGQVSEQKFNFSNYKVLDYSNYAIFLKDYERIMTNSNPFNKYNHLNLLIQDKSYPIFVSRDPELLQTFMEKHFNIFTTQQSPKQNYIQLQENIININLDNLLKTIQSDTNCFSQSQIKQIQPLVYGTQDKTPQECVYLKQKQLQSFYPSNLLKEYQILSTMCTSVSGTTPPLQNILTRIEKQLNILDTLSNLHAQNTTFILPNLDAEKQRQRKFIQKIQFLLSDQRTLTEFTSYENQKLHQLFQQASVTHCAVKCKGDVIGIVDTRQNIQYSIAKIGIQQPTNLDFSFQQNVIQIKDLFIEVTISDIVSTFPEQKQSKITRLLKGFRIQIVSEDNRQVITNLNQLSTNHFKINCKYPRRSIEMRLVNAQMKQLMHFIIRHYSYGSRYNLIGIQKYLVPLLETLEKENKDIRSLQKCYSVGDIPRQINLGINKKGPVQYSETDDSSLEISIVLSENNQDLRQLILEFQDQKSKILFSDLKSEIQQRRKQKTPVQL